LILVAWGLVALQGIAEVLRNLARLDGRLPYTGEEEEEA